MFTKQIACLAPTTITLIGLLVHPVIASAQEDNARVSLNVGSVLPYVFSDTLYGATSARLFNRGSSPEGAFWTGLAEAEVGMPGEDIVGPYLRAQVGGTAPTYIDRVTAPMTTGGGASASYYDELTFSGLISPEDLEKFFPKDPNDPSNNLLVVTFHPSVNGDLFGNATARFRFSTSTNYDNVTYQEVHTSWEPTEFSQLGPEGRASRISGTNPLYARVPVVTEYLFDDGMYRITSSSVLLYSMGLSVSAASYPAGVTSGADYQHTAILGPIGLQFEDGTPAANVIQDIRITGASGVNYVVAVPEPNSFVLASLAGLTAIVWSRFRK